MHFALFNIKKSAKCFVGIAKCTLFVLAILQKKTELQKKTIMEKEKFELKRSYNGLDSEKTTAKLVCYLEDNLNDYQFLELVNFLSSKKGIITKLKKIGRIQEFPMGCNVMYSELKKGDK